MPLSLSLPTSLEYFASLVQSDDHFPLLEAAASLAQDEYPELDVQQLLGDMDQLLARIQRRLPADAPALQRLRTLNQFFFTDLGFGGNVNNYYDPENSYLNAVLCTRRGIPISLAVLWMELAQGLGLHVRGIAFPGHFMVKVLLPQAWGEWRDRGLAHAERGNTAEAVADLETYLAHAEDGLDIDLIADRLNALRSAS